MRQNVTNDVSKDSLVAQNLFNRERKMACAIGFGFASDWLKSGGRVLSQLQSAAIIIT